MEVSLTCRQGDAPPPYASGMPEVVVGLLHPGEMGAELGAALTARGADVVWASEGRSEATRRRAGAARLRDVETIDAVARAAGVILSVCPPHAAVELARAVAGFGGTYVDANAIAPATVRAVAGEIGRGGGRVVDASIVGPPPRSAGTTRLFVSGPGAGEVADLFAGTPLEARVVSDVIGSASAVKMAYAAWTKGTSALILAIRALARAEGVEPELLREWRSSQPELAGDSAAAARSAATKGWRWIGEMEEIAAALADVGLPDGFMRAAAEVYRRTPRSDVAQDEGALIASIADALVPTR